ncbi:MAG TPA: hypothetical protein DIW27_04205, partial [Cytophagales bacterium]|nr:hypothetical protein [Cytophagales bacterium]
MQVFKIFLLSLFAFALSDCTQPSPPQSGESGLYDTDNFKNYWYAGKAEVNAYNLEQSRYGETQKGKAMLIFVTEAFSKSKQVKLDNPNIASEDKVTVMKLNYSKNFVTGIYPYSMMLSSFTPVSRNEFPNTLKVSMTSQEWCGHVFTQMNLRNYNYDVSSYSYFEQEGDTQFSLNKVLLEDELLNLIRIDPDHIPNGEITIIPGLFFTRLNHEALRPTLVTISKEIGAAETIYSIQYPERILTIRADLKFPHQILGWQEEHTEGGKKMFTKATLDKTL